MKTRLSFILIAIILNAILFVLGLFDIFDSWPLYQVPLFQMGWLFGLGGKFGLDVAGKSNEFASLPNSLGWLLIVIGTLITIFLYYWLYRTLFNRERKS